MAEQGPADQQSVSTEKDQEDGQQHLHRLLDPAQVERDQEADGHEFGRELPGGPGRGQEAEDGIAAAGDRDGDGEHVVHH
jgi:hypothetical protein